MDLENVFCSTHSENQSYMKLVLRQYPWKYNHIWFVVNKILLFYIYTLRLEVFISSFRILILIKYYLMNNFSENILKNPIFWRVTQYLLGHILVISFMTLLFSYIRLHVNCDFSSVSFTTWIKIILFRILNYKIYEKLF